ncbi:hypothetical protein BV25DRAFT_1917956 [Artomyces pyxidatus]|uniref:Uncharacterized protein n=1 Tax=Artomyces pyxidatus TaxID=48021 RepID=A0ACB8SV55_9AGAM|nr:hypothetical protein BV25DRAFT_1917956 [Artomyces pyxidatus]
MTSTPARTFWNATVAARIPILDVLTHYGATVPDNCTEIFDAEINALNDIMWLVKTRRNSAASYAVRLPADVLRIIFSMAKESPNPKKRNSLNAGTYAPRPLWINLTHVCHRWREIALNFPILWTDLDLSAMSATWAKEFLRRSRTSELSVTTSYPFSRGKVEMVEAVLKPSVVARLTHLSLALGPDNISHLLYDRQFSAPLLQTFSMSQEEPDRISFYRRPRPSMRLPRRLFGGETPRLHTLALVNTPIYWETSDLFVNLTTFSIIFGKGHLPSGWFPDGEQVLDVLRAMHKLEKLVLHRSLRQSHHMSKWNDAPAPEDIVELPNIYQISLKGPDSYGLAVRLVGPPSACLSVEGDPLERNSPHLRTIVRRFLGEATVVPRSLALQIRRDETKLSFTAIPTSTRVLEPGLVSIPASAELLLGDIWQNIFVTDLEELRINVEEDSPWTRWRWLELFGRLENVRSLHVEGKKNMESFLRALTPLKTDPSTYMPGMPSVMTLFPRMSRLVLGSRFHGAHCWQASALNDSAQNLFELLYSCLLARRERGYPPLLNLEVEIGYGEIELDGRLDGLVENVKVHSKLLPPPGTLQMPGYASFEIPADNDFGYPLELPLW